MIFGGLYARQIIRSLGEITVFLNKIENFYLAIMRVLVLIIVTLALLGFVGGGVAWFFSSEGKASKFEPVTAVELLAGNGKVVLTEPNLSSYQKIYTSIDMFIKSNSKDAEPLDKDELFSKIHEFVQAYTSEEDKSVFLSSMADVIGTALQDSSTKEKLKEGEEPYDVAFGLLDVYQEKYSEKYTKSLMSTNGESPMSSLYKIIGVLYCLMIFISLIFVFLLSKIERNLRAVKQDN